MFFHALATDYDGTIATDGDTPSSVVDALKRFKANRSEAYLGHGGVKFLIFKIAFPDHGLFDRIVAENGAIVYDPSTRSQRALGPKAPEKFHCRATRKKCSAAQRRGRNCRHLGTQ